MKPLYGLTLASIAFALALAVPAFVPGLQVRSHELEHVSSTMTSSPRSLCGNIFDNTGSLCGPRHEAPRTAAVIDEPIKCDVPVLLGIVHGGSADRALFAGLGVVKQGDAFDNGYALIEVHTDRAVFARGDSRCEVRLFQPSGERVSNDVATGSFRRHSGRLQIPRGVLASAGPQSLAGIRAAPTRHGIRLGGIAPGSLAARLGLRSGDLIVQVDGRALTPDSAIELASRLDRLEHVSALVRRGNEELTLAADIID